MSTEIARNVDDHRRVWPSLNRADGRVLELDSGEETELDEVSSERLRAGVPHLKLMAPKKQVKPADGQSA